MKSRILTLLFSFFLVVGFGQKRPDQFTEETSPTDANFEVYSQKNGQVRRASLLNLKKYYTPDVNTTDITYTPAATGNALNLMEFVKNAGDSIYYIDAGGDAFLLRDPNASGTTNFTDDSYGADMVESNGDFSTRIDIEELELYSSPDPTSDHMVIRKGSNGQIVKVLLDSVRGGQDIQYNSSDSYKNYLNIFSAQARDYTMAGLEYVDATHRRIYQNIKGNQWSSWELDKLSTGSWRVAQPKYYEGVSPVDNTDDTLTFVGTTQVIANSGSMGTSYTRFDGVGEYVEWTFSGKTELFLVAATLTNGGIVNVTLDGGTDGLNLVPLSGGLRQIDTYNPDNSNTNIRIPLSNILNPTVTYTVRVTTTGTKNASSSDPYLNFEGFGTNLQNIDEALGVLYALKLIKTIGYLGSEYEYAYQIKPSGATAFEWTGSGHLNETMTTKILNANGDSIDVDATNTTYISKSFKITEVGITNHSELGVTPVANVFVEKEFTGGQLNIFHTHRWLIATEVNSALVAMFPVREEFNVGYVIGDNNGPYSLTSDNDNKVGGINSQMAYTYDPSLNFYAALYVHSLESSNNYIDSIDKTYIEDRSGGSLNKIYFQRAKAGVTIEINEVWESSQTYLIGFNSNIADLAN